MLRTVKHGSNPRDQIQARYQSCILGFQFTTFLIICTSLTIEFTSLGFHQKNNIAQVEIPLSNTGCKILSGQFRIFHRRNETWFEMKPAYCHQRIRIHIIFQNQEVPRVLEEDQKGWMDTALETICPGKFFQSPSPPHDLW